MGTHLACWEAEQLGQFLLVRLAGRHVRLGAHYLGVLGEEVEAQALDFRGTEVVFDLDNVVGVDSAQLGQLLSLGRRLHARGLRLTLAGLSPYLDDLFRTNGLAGMLDLHRNEELYPHDEPLLVWEATVGQAG